MWPNDPKPRSSEPKKLIPVHSFDMYFETPVFQGERKVASLNFFDADLLAEAWKTRYGLYPKKLFHYENNGGGLSLVINNLMILGSWEYENFFTQFLGWKKLLTDETGTFDTGEPGNSILFRISADNSLILELYQNFRWGDNSWVFPDAKAFRVALMHAYADVANWVRAADPIYYEELLKNGTLPVPAPDKVV